MITNHMYIAMQNIAFEAQRLQNITQMLINNTAKLPSESQPLESSSKHTPQQQSLSDKGHIINIIV